MLITTASVSNPEPGQVRHPISEGKDLSRILKLSRVVQLLRAIACGHYFLSP